MGVYRSRVDPHPVSTYGSAVLVSDTRTHVSSVVISAAGSNASLSLWSASTSDDLAVAARKVRLTCPANESRGFSFSDSLHFLTGVAVSLAPTGAHAVLGLGQRGA